MRKLLDDVISFLRALVSPVVSSIRGNASLAVLSVVLAFAIWIFVTDTENPTRSGVLPIDIPVEPVNVPEGLTVGEDIPPVRLRIEVAEDIWDSLTVDDFQATVDLRGLDVGLQDVPVEAEALTRRGGLRITQVIPAEVPIDLRPLFSKSVPVMVEVKGSPPVGFQAGEPRLDPEQVVVSGPQDRVNLVGAAVTQVDVSGATSDIRQSFRLEPRDERGFLVEGVVLEPSVVAVRLVIEQKQFSRPYAVSPSLQGSPAAGYNVVSVQVDPPAVTVLGPLELLDVTSVISTEEIDVTGATDDVVATVSLQLPAGASVSGSNSVTVRVDIDPALGEITLAVSPQFAGLAGDLRVTTSPPLLQVTLAGELPTLLDLKPEQVEATVDLVGLAAGTHSVKPEVEAPSGLRLVSVTPSEFPVTISEGE